MADEFKVSGAGLGLRRGLFKQFRDYSNELTESVDFFECAPENWVAVGGNFGTQFRDYVERFPFVCHGLSLSIGSPSPLDLNFLAQVRQFLDDVNAVHFSEHLSYCSDYGHLYDLMPIPFTSEAVDYVVDRIKQVQSVLERRIAIENVSYYAAPHQELDEIEFINHVLEGADCLLLLDVNNIYVNSVNFSYDPIDFLEALPGQRIAYAHIAGHKIEAADLRIDTHAAPVIDPVWQLLDHAYSTFGVVPTVLERDFNFPRLPDLLDEVEHIRSLQAKYTNAG